jgi:hypothetical protein
VFGSPRAFLAPEFGDERDTKHSLLKSPHIGRTRPSHLYCTMDVSHILSSLFPLETVDSALHPLFALVAPPSISRLPMFELLAWLEEYADKNATDVEARLQIHTIVGEESDQIITRAMEFIDTYESQSPYFFYAIHTTVDRFFGDENIVAFADVKSLQPALHCSISSSVDNADSCHDHD